MVPEEMNGVLRESAIDVRLEPGGVVRAPIGRADFIFPFDTSEVAEFIRDGENLVVVLDDGQQIIIQGYYTGSYEYALIFTDEVVAFPLWLAIGAGALGLGTLAAVASGGDDGGNPTVDSTGPVIGVRSGFISTGDVRNEEDAISDGRNDPNYLELSGISEPGASISVTIDGITRSADVGDDGIWTVLFDAAEIETGTYSKDAVIVATDPAGNTTEITEAINVDTELNATLNVLAGDDATINLAERADGVTVSGTADPGSSIILTVGRTIYPSTNADKDGNWSVLLRNSDVPTGSDEDLFVQATVTDVAGNTLKVDDEVKIDTVVDNLAITSEPVSSSQTLNVAGAMDGVTFGGTVEPLSDIKVMFDVDDKTAAQKIVRADADGKWTVTFELDELPTGAYDAEVNVQAIDPHGNVDTVSTASISVDTEAPDVPFIVGFNQLEGELTGLTIKGAGDTFKDIQENMSFFEVSANGSVSETEFSLDLNSPSSALHFSFEGRVSNGSQLVITEVDSADNSSSTLFVFNTAANNNLDLNAGGLEQFDLKGIDLSFPTSTTVLVNKDTIAALSDTSNEVIIFGNGNDSVVIDGVTSKTASSTDGYTKYTFADSNVALIIDDDINVSHSVI